MSCTLVVTWLDTRQRHVTRFQSFHLEVHLVHLHTAEYVKVHLVHLNIVEYVMVCSYPLNTLKKSKARIALVLQTYCARVLSKLGVSSITTSAFMVLARHAVSFLDLICATRKVATICELSRQLTFPRCIPTHIFLEIPSVTGQLMAVVQP